MTSASASRICPACGARNSELSIFCAECGGDLNSGNWQESDQTETFVPAAGDTWTTATVPAAAESKESPHERPPTYATFTYGAQGAVSTWADNSAETSRGFYLGLIAWLLILAVFGAYLWSSVLSSGLRDDIRDLIPGL